MNRVLITTDYLRPGDAVDEYLRQHGLETVHRPHTGPRTTDELDEIFNGVVAALVANEPIDERTLRGSPQLQVLARSGVGYDAIDVDAATRLGIAVCSAPGSNSTAVAEMALVALLMCARRIVPIIDGVRDGAWPRMDGRDLRGATLGVVGFGPAGRRVAELASALGMRVLVHTRHPADGFHVTFVPLSTLLAEADYVTLHCRATQLNRGMFDADALGAMKAGAFLVNTARGSLVDENALAAAVASGHLAGAVLDVVQHEPLPMDDPLRQVPGIVVLSHLAGQTREARLEASEVAARSLIAVLTGETTDTVVNPTALQRQGRRTP